MKFSEMPYTRPDVDAFRKMAEDAVLAIEKAVTPEEAAEAFEAFDREDAHVSTLINLCYIRQSVNTRDEFYEKEQEFLDGSMPALQEATQRVQLALLQSPHRKALEERYGKLLFENLEISVRSFSPEIMELMAEENRLASRYQKLTGSAMVIWEGEEIPLPLLGPHMQSTDREVRHRAMQTAAEFYEKNRGELDEIYGLLVKNRNAQARALGHKNYIELGYDRLGRNCYRYAELTAYREQIARDVVPVVSRVRRAQAERIGLDRLMLWDAGFLFPDGNADPQGTPDEILQAGHKMYTEMSEETREFADRLFGDELYDVLSKPGKAPGGYCTDLADYKAPFIFSNFNGTAGDVDVLTHEAGHAFASFRSFKKDLIGPYRAPTIEACEVHSMSMEFLTEPWHRLFFGDLTEKYELGHAADALTFLPYGCMVDEFQHIMYENEDLSPDERNAVWLDLEKKYRPDLDAGDLPFYSRGAGWQRQLHIYLYPLYYIDYCMAQSVAFGFWCLAMEDEKEAFRRYLSFVDMAGTRTFAQLVTEAGLPLPYAEGTMKAVSETVGAWLAQKEEEYKNR